VARYSEINLDKDTFKDADGNYKSESTSPSTVALTNVNSAYSDITKSAESAKTWTAGVNWYLNKNTKFAINYAQTSFDGGAGSSTAATGSTGGSISNKKDREDEKAILARFQVQF
jgi:phosphate-selective porin OprO/OprP